MPSLKEVRTRIESVNSTKQITSAMKMVSASKLRRAQNAILKLRPYALKLNEILQNLSKSIENSDDDVYSQVRPIQKILFVVIASNRGLCGAFNANVIKEANRIIQTDYKKQFDEGNVFVHCFGKKIVDFYNNSTYNVVGKEIDLFTDLSFENVVAIAKNMMADFAAKNYDKIILVYNQFKNAAVYQLSTEQFLPIVASDTENKVKDLATDYIFEPDKETVVKELIPKSLKIQFYKALLDSYASEHGARMTAMHKATDNAIELLKDLKLKYNKARQASITNEILEIVSGAEALKG
ncbi:MAG: ATP synthase F1 subunit gamma [Bacteroidetes bacterium]|nr:ATP synthase F1 subunit gamma [Bacteroidota bacterium]